MAASCRLRQAYVDLNKKVTAQMPRDRDILGWFELGGLAAPEIEKQMLSLPRR
jgi:hypothetical protein